MLIGSTLELIHQALTSSKPKFHHEYTQITHPHVSVQHAQVSKLDCTSRYSICALMQCCCLQNLYRIFYAQSTDLPGLLPPTNPWHSQTCQQLPLLPAVPPIVPPAPAVPAVPTVPVAARGAKRSRGQAIVQWPGSRT